MTSIPIDDYQSVELLILSGMLDDKLDEVIAAVRRRREFLAAQRVTKLTTNATCKLINLRPKHLNGKRVRIISFEGDKVRCEMLEHSNGAGNARNWSRGSIVTVPNTCLEPV